MYCNLRHTNSFKKKSYNNKSGCDDNIVDVHLSSYANDLLYAMPRFYYGRYFCALDLDQSAFILGRITPLFLQLSFLGLMLGH